MEPTPLFLPNKEGFLRLNPLAFTEFKNTQGHPKDRYIYFSNYQDRRVHGNLLYAKKHFILVFHGTRLWLRANVEYRRSGGYGGWCFKTDVYGIRFTGNETVFDLIELFKKYNVKA